MRERGRWILEYQTFSSSDVSNPSGIVQQRVELDKRTKRGAVRKGKKIWKERIARGRFKGWNNVTYPHSPRVVREIPIK